jgi:hypothetical protein
MKSGCTHGNIGNRPNFSLSPADLINIPSLARSIGNIFIKQIWTKDFDMYRMTKPKNTEPKLSRQSEAQQMMMKLKYLAVEKF